VIGVNMEDRIQKLIDVYTTYVFGVDRDAGWHAPSQLEALQSASMALKSGKSSKFLTVRFSTSAEHQVNDKPDDKMINEMRFIRAKHHDFELAKMLFSRLEEKQLLAMLAETHLKIVYKTSFTAKKIGEYLEVTPATYRHNKKSALLKIENQLLFIDQYEEAKSVIKNRGLCLV